MPTAPKAPKKTRRRRRGRPRTRPLNGVTHDRRESFSGREPVMVTLRVRRGLRSLRGRRPFAFVRRALGAGKERFGMRLIHFSVQSNHLHMIVEAADRRSLSRGMQGLGIRLAKAVNRALGRSGSVFAQRYHARRIETPLDAKRAIAYVLNNARKHHDGPLTRYPDEWLDPCSSALGFDGWYGRAPPRERDPATVAPRTDLLAWAWRAWGLL